MENKRKELRFEIAVPVEVPAGVMSGRDFYATTRDLSVSGLKVFSEQPFTPGKSFRVNLNLVSETVKVNVRVIWSRRVSRLSRYISGLSFSGLPASSLQAVSAFLSEMDPSRGKCLCQ